MSKKLLLSIFLLLLTALTTSLCFSKQDDSQRATFSELIATTSETHMILFGVVNNSFTEEMIAGLQSGVPVHFSFFVELFQKKEGEIDDPLARLAFRHTMTYDTLKDSYRVELGETNNKIVVLPTLEEAKKTMREVNGVNILPLTRLFPDNAYQLRIRAELYEKTLPMSLHRVLPFLSWWDLETDWHTLEFNY